MNRATLWLLRAEKESVEIRIPNWQRLSTRPRDERQFVVSAVAPDERADRGNSEKIAGLHWRLTNQTEPRAIRRQVRSPRENLTAHGATIRQTELGDDE